LAKKAPTPIPKIEMRTIDSPTLGNAFLNKKSEFFSVLNARIIKRWITYAGAEL